MASHVQSSAAAYQLPGAIFVHAQSRTNAGVWVASLPAKLFPREIDAESLGAFSAEALAQSGLIEIADYSAASAPVLAAAGVKSRSRIQRDGKLCLLSRSSSGLVVIPTRNGGSKGWGRGFHELADNSIKLHAGPSGKELGLSILSGFALCQ